MATGRTGGRGATTGVIPGRYVLAVGMPALPCPQGWKWTPLTQVAQLESGHTPSRRHHEYWDGKIPWIGLRDAVDHNGNDIDDTIQHVTEEGLANSSARLLPANTVCLSRTASIGYVVVMRQPMATSQDFVNWVCGPQINPQFLKYVFLVENEALWRFAHGTTHQTIYYPEAKAFHVCLPPLSEQRGIVRILGALDAKIHANEGLNKTLEAIGKAIFKHWFIDFEFPNEEGKPYKSSGGEMIYNEKLGKEIPKGWLVETLDAVAKLNPEAWSKNSAPEEIAYVDLSNVKWGKIEEIQKVLWKDAPSRAQRVLRPGDTIIGTVRPGNGSFSLVSEEGMTGSTGFAVLRPRSEIYREYLYMISTSSENIRRLSHLADGAAYPAVRPDSVLATQIALPVTSLIERFARVARPIMTKIALNDKESRLLATIRDGLLPKLVSGKIRVPLEAN